MSESLWSTPAARIERAERLVACGFNCFKDTSSPDEELRYAEYEFQLYSMHAKWLGKKDGGVVKRAPSQQVCEDLQALTAGLRLGEEWSQGWDDCLKRWSDPADPDGPYVCPVVIARAEGKFGNPDENTQPGPFDRDNVWTISKGDLQKYFFASDVSGMFAISDDDPGYQPDAGYTPPEGIFEEQWLFDPRSFMQIHPFREKLLGVAVQPWRACEFLPALLGHDAARIRANPQWRSLYRIIRCLSQVECDGFFDRLQGYDASHMSLPLYHYTLPGTAVNQALGAELGGVLIWLERFDPALARAFAAAGLSAYKRDPAQAKAEHDYKERHWADDRSWGKLYDGDSGDGCGDGARVTGCVSIGAGVVDSKDDMPFLRRPHFHYRVTMLMRTLPAVRVAQWKLAVHRLRNLAWLALEGLPKELAEREVLGQVLTSELAMAIVLRLHIFQPSAMLGTVVPAIKAAWKASRDAYPDKSVAELQAEFEHRFCQGFFVGALENERGAWQDKVEDSNLSKLPGWPFKNESAFGSRLRQSHLEGDGRAAPSDPLPPRLSWGPLTSPFWTAAALGKSVFADPVAGLEGNPDFAGDGYPAVPMRYPVIAKTEDFRDLGTQVVTPAAFGKFEVHGQRVREALAIRAAAHVLVGGKLVPNQRVLERRLHGDRAQFWARRHIAEMRRGEVASALRCAATPAAPAPADALWALDSAVAQGATVYAFDWRAGPPAAGKGGEAFAQAGADGKIASSGDRFAVSDPGNFGVFLLPLQEKTFSAFAQALGTGAGVTHVDQFHVVPGAKGWTLTVAGMRQAFPLNAAHAAAPSELGLLIEYLAWRHAERSEDHDGWYGGPFNVLRDLGFDAWVPQAAASSPAFLRQPWPDGARAIAATANTQSKPAPLDELTLRCAPRLWNAPAPLSPPSNGELVAAMLSWPSLYRMRRLFQDSAEARRAVYDLWRMGMRAALSLSVTMLKPEFGKNLPRAYQLFQSADAIAALACWRYVDSAGLARALHLDTGPVAAAAKAWFAADPARRDFRAWNSTMEHTFLWDALVPAIKERASRDALMLLKPPLPRPPRVYREQLAEVMDLEGLDVTAPPIPQIDYQAVLLRQPAANVGLGLLASAAPAPAAPGALAALAAPLDADQFWVGGIVPVLKVGAGFKAVPLMLPQPALVRLSRGPAETVQVGTYWARDGAEEVLDFAALDIGEPFTIEADVSSWLGELAQDMSLTLLASAGAPAEGTFALSLGLRLASAWLHKPLEWSRQLVEISGVELADVDGGKELVWRFPFADLADKGALPIRLDDKAGIELGLGLKSGAVTARFSARAATLTVGLGSPVASLRLETEGAPLAFDADLANGGAVVSYPDSFAAYLALELAALPGAAGAAARIVPTGERTAKDVRIPPFDILLARFGAPAGAAMALDARPGIDLSDLARPRIPAWLFAAGPASYTKTPACRLLDIAAEWLEGAADALGAFLEADKPPTIAREGERLALALPVRITVATHMTAETTLKASCAVDGQGYLLLRGDSFACGLSQISLSLNVGHDQLKLGSIAGLTLPPKLEAMLTLDGSDPGNCFRLVIPPDGPHPVLTVPASGGIEFDIGEFALGSGGLTLAAKVSKDVVKLDLPVLDKDLAVQEPKDGIGEFHIVRGRLISASLQAKVRLKVFDDAEGVLTMRIVQDSGGLTIMAELDVGVGKTFHLRALYLQVIVASINLSLSYGPDGGWKAKGGLTGSMKFVPEGPMLGRLAEYKSLFDGTSVHFEKMDLARLGESPITVMVTPRTFDVGSMFSVTWRGFVLQRPGDLQSFMGLRLLGDITFKQRLPKMRVALTLGDITIRQLRADSLIPKIAISSIGVDIALSGGFAFKGRVTEFDDAYEYGFGGEVELRSEAFPATQAMIKLTRLKGDPSKPSIAVYASTERNDSLGYGFFLRKVGIGVGIRQGLRGFSDEPGQPRAIGIAERVERALKDPRGLPYPAHLSSWQPLTPDQRPEFTLVAYILVTFGLLKPDVDHPLAASAVLAIDDNLDIIVGLNGWFVTSPDNTGDDAYIASPAIKGALALSPREQVLYGRFMTLPNSKFGPTAAGNPMMVWLKQALDAVRLSVSMYADPRGGLIEIGWPRNARFDMSLGPASGWAEAGFRFGFYRGTQVVGLNLAVHAEISGGFSQDMGFANVSLSVVARMQLQAAFAGAVTSAGQYYVLAEVTLSALLEISARAYKRIHISGWGFSFDVTLFDVSATFGISATAILQTAIVPSGLGFNGSVEVHIRIAGFGIGARVRISSSEGRVDEARSTIAALVPPIGELIKAGSRSVAAPVQALAPAAKDAVVGALAAPAVGAGTAKPVAPKPEAIPGHWRCYVVRTGDELRVVLFPNAQGVEEPVGYPRQASAVDGPAPFAPRKHTLWLHANVADAFRGVVGAESELPPAPRGTLEVSLVEEADKVLLPLEWLRKQRPDAPRALYAGDLLADLAVEVPEVPEEVVDPRTIQPVAGDFDDPAVLADPARRSTRFRRRYSQDEVPTYDDHVRRATETERNDPRVPTGATSSGELLMQLLNMARDGSVLPGRQVDGPGPDDTVYSPHLLASRLGLVLSFTWSAPLEAALIEGGLAAIVDPEKPQALMFGRPIGAHDWSSEAGHRARFQIVPGYVFQGKGEVGLVWSVLRTSAIGDVVRKGPANHEGIAAFRVQRLRNDRSELPASATMKVIPSWLKYARGNTAYYLRPQFQFLDTGLPPSGTALVEYLVEALADDGKDTVLASQVIPVDYRAPSNAFSLVQAEATLHLPPEAAAVATAAPAPYWVELQLQIDVDRRAAPDRLWTATPAALATLAGRIELLRRRLDQGVLGRYGQGHDGQVSVSWSQEDKACGISLPQTDQARQLSIADFDTRSDVIGPLAWQFDQVDDPLAKALTCRARVEIRAATEQADWDRLLGPGGNCAELHVRLKKDPGGPNVPPELATALLRCRIGLTRELAARGDGAQAKTERTEGTEVAGLERLPLAAASERVPEWLPVAISRFRAEVSAWPFGAGERPPTGVGEQRDEIGLRLRGIINHARAGAHPYGAVVGYRIWALDRFDAQPDRRSTLLADFLVEPEALYRATPVAVTVRQLAGGPPGQPNWRFEGAPLRIPAVSAPAQTGFRACRLEGGNQVSLHASLAALADDLSRGEYSAQLHADEPMWPAASADGGRLAQLVKRNPPASDIYGWRLLEALGGCATVWLARDDDRIGIEAWEEILAAHAPDVLALTFSRLQPGERPDERPLSLYGVRVFSRAMLAELLAIAAAGKDTAEGLALAGSQLALALRLVEPPAKSGDLKAGDIPDAWIACVESLLARLDGFIARTDKDHPERLRAAMWELAKVPAAAQAGDTGTRDVKAQYPAVLPALDGQLHFFHTLENGYARELEMAVEVVRRYDIVAPREARSMPAGAIHQVPVMRTLALEAERWAMSPDPQSGALTALVAVHSAQRLVLYRSDLAARVQFIEQRVRLQRAVAAPASAGWDAMFGALGAGFDRAAYQRTWVIGEEASAPPLSAWTLVDDEAGQAVNRGFDTYRYADLAPFYEHGVHVATQAGVRHSAENLGGEAAPAMSEAMFTDGAGLSYPAPRMAWTLTEEGETLRFAFPLVRGADALRPAARAHWIARDQLWQVRADDDDTGLEVPVLQLPDLRARYSLVATGASREGPPLRVELVTLEHAGPRVLAHLLVGPDAGKQEVRADLVQLGEQEDEGRIGIACELTLSQVELSWLRTGLRSETGEWRLTIEVQRGGVHYRSQGITS